jgi:hypothetical protein
VGFTLFILLAGGAFMSRAAYQREIAVEDHHAASGFARTRALGALLAPTDLVYALRDAEPLSSNFTSQSFAVNMAEKLHEIRIVHGKETIARDWVLNRSSTGFALSDRCGLADVPLSWTSEGRPQGRAKVGVRNSGTRTYSGSQLVTPEGVFELGPLPPGTTTFDAPRKYDSAATFASAEGGERRQPENYYPVEGRISEEELNSRVRALFIQLSFGETQGASGFARDLDARRFIRSGGSVLVAWSPAADPEVRFEPLPSRQSGYRMTRVFSRPEPR